MAKKKRQRVSYVLPLASTPGGHRLGINGLAFDRDRDILYTGGRDGVVCAWDLNLSAEYTQQEDKTLPSNRKTATFRRQVQAHTHWVNDILLVKNNLAVISASSDAAVKLWRPHSHDAIAAYSIGSHSDYIKCLATPHTNSTWVASGGLDNKVRLWDVAGNGQLLEIDIKKADGVIKGSVYALKAKGNVIASAGPEGVCRLWDANSGKSITKLVGHTDMIRDILLSDDGDTVLTGSSDQTIKVWSMAAGRCLHTLTMHNDSVWTMYSDDPTLSVFYSGDRSGLVQKTDTRRAMEIDDGLSVAVCQEHDGITRIAITGDSIWTATSNSSINRWQDVNTALEVESTPASPSPEQKVNGTSKSSSPLSSSIPIAEEEEGRNDTPGRQLTKIPYNAVLRLSNTAPIPGRRHERNLSVTNLRRASEAVMDTDLVFTSPIRGHPEETIEGQNGLTKHIMLNDKKRVLTLDTAGEVVLWDLLKCVQIQSFGRKHLDEVLPEINTAESVANWCTVDTKTGKLTVMLEENYAFDAEVYADEIELAERIEFREDQRLNLGKWVLRNLFTTLLNEEVKRDENFRQSLRAQPVSSQAGIQRLGAPTSIALPSSQGQTPMVSPGTLLTPRAHNGLVASTPGLHIGLATPAAPSATGHSPLVSTGGLSPFPEEESGVEPRAAPQSPDTAKQENNHDYFSARTLAPLTLVTSQSEQASQPDTAQVMTPTSPNDEKKKSGIFGKKFPMNFPKLGRTITETSKPATSTTEDKAEDSDRSSEKEPDTPQTFEDNFLGVVQRIRHRYSEQLQADSESPVVVGITPSQPIETPVLKPPPHTVVIIQEDDPESGGLTDLYQGEISELGKDADTLEKIAPMWLGELLLKNAIPVKDTVKISFVLLPYEDLLPPLSSPNDSSARLNANRMLRAKKIVAYICERIEASPPPATTTAAVSQTAMTTTTQPEDIDTATAAAADDDDTTSTVEPSVPEAEQQPTPLRPEEYLDLICQGQKVDPNMTLATLRVHVWRGGGDIVLYYKANGKKEIKLPHPVDVAGRDEGMGTQVSSV